MVLEMKILKAHKQRKRYKRPGSILMTSIVAVIVWIFIAQCMFVTSAGGFEMIKSSRTALQSQQYAQITIDRLKRLYYDELDEYGAHDRAVIPGLPSDDWEDEVTIEPELDIPGSEDIKQRIATVNIYKKDDTLPRYSVEVPFSSLDNKLPVGSIMAWPSNTPPSHLEWLECNGQRFDTAKYKRLANVFPSGILPDLREKFLEGHDSAGTNISAGLPGWYHWSGNHLTYSNKKGVSGTMAFFGGGGMMQNSHIDHIQHVEDIIIGGYQFLPSYSDLTTNSFNIPITVSGNINVGESSQNITLNGEIPITLSKRTLGVWQDLVTPTTIKSNVFYGGYDIRNPAGDYNGQYFPDFDYYKGQHLYGKTDTVQPNSFTVKFYVKAR